MYRKIKRIDAYEEVIENIKRYALANEKNKDAVSLKYILVNGLNDRQDEIEKFIEIAKEIGLSNVTFSLNHKNAIFEGKRVSREWYDLMESLLNRRDIEVRLPLQAHKILEKGYIF
jgi:adenine C2-methylase RlmN of 23S rRNA A2503 and tRNA A37